MSETHNPTPEEGGPAMFQPDTLLPSQFFAALRQKGLVEGEKRLMAAVLADAVECYMKQLDSLEPRGRQLFEDAEAWIFTENKAWFFSFDTICEILNLDPAYIRQGILEWRRKRTPTLRRATAFRRPTHSVAPVPDQDWKKAVG
jgi:hypothetical protein